MTTENKQTEMPQTEMHDLSPTGDPALESLQLTGEKEPAASAEPPADLPAILEAMLFTMDKAVTLAQLVTALKPWHRDIQLAQVRQALRDLAQDYQDPERKVGLGFELQETGGGWLLVTRAQFVEYLGSLSENKPQRLSRAALEALAVIAYRQPVTRPQIDDVRGVDSSSALRYLLDKQLVRVLGKSEELGRPLLYGTTPEFLQLLGLKSLSHLPTLQEFQELDEEHQARVEQAHGKPPVQVADLVNGEGRVVSDETESASAQALLALEEALLEAEETRHDSEQILGPGQEENSGDKGKGGAAVSGEELAIDDEKLGDDSALANNADPADQNGIENAGADLDENDDDEMGSESIDQETWAEDAEPEKDFTD